MARRTRWFVRGGMGASRRNRRAADDELTADGLLTAAGARWADGREADDTTCTDADDGALPTLYNTDTAPGLTAC